MHDGPALASILETGAAAILFASIFLVRLRRNPLRALMRDTRDIVSFGAGLSAAYVFLHVLPGLDVVRDAYVESTSIPIWFEGRGVYLLALVGFLAFYSLNNVTSRLRQSAGSGRSQRAFRLQIGGFAAYLWLMGYLLLQALGHSNKSVLLFAVAIAFHLLGVDHDLRSKHGAAYEKRGRFLLAAMGVIGWGAGLVIALPHALLALMLAFVAGAVIMNSAIIELPSGEDVRARPFLLGGIVYGVLLLLLH